MQADFGSIDILAYATPTAEGIAHLRIFAMPEVWDEHGLELELNPLLFEFHEP